MAVTPPSADVLGDFILTDFGLTQVSTGDIIRNQDDYEPWSGTMTIDPYEITKWICKTGNCWVDRDGYKFIPGDVILDFAGGRLIFSPDGNNQYYQIDDPFLIIYRYFTGYMIGSMNYGACYEYEYWKKVSDY